MEELNSSDIDDIPLIFGNKIFFCCKTENDKRIKFYKSIINGDLKEFSNLAITYHLDVNLKLKNGFTLINLIMDTCISETWPDLVTFLINNGAHLNTRDKHSVTLLSRIVISGEYSLLKLALDLGADKEITGLNGETPLLTAVHYKQIECLRLLLEHGADVNSIAADGNSPLMWAASRSNGIGMQRSLTCVKLLIKNGAQVDFSNTRSYTPLMSSVIIHEIEVARYLLFSGANADITDNKGETALHKASYSGGTDVLQLLLNFGANTNVKDNTGQTPLFHASSLDILEKLLEFGCTTDVNDEDRNGNTVAHIISESNDIDKLQLLINYGGEIDKRNKKGDTPILLALRNRSYAMVEYLLSFDIEIGVKNDMGIYAIHELFIPSNFYGTLDIFPVLCSKILMREFQIYSNYHLNNIVTFLHQLLERNVNIQSVTEEGISPLMLSILTGSYELVSILLKYGASPEDVDNSGRGTLAYAAKCGNISIVKLLLSRGVIPNVKDVYGNMPIFYAAHFNHIDICNLLLLDFVYYCIYNKYISK